MGGPVLIPTFGYSVNLILCFNYTGLLHTFIQNGPFDNKHFCYFKKMKQFF